MGIGKRNSDLAICAMLSSATSTMPMPTPDLPDLGALSLVYQQQLVIEDLLYTLSGISGQYVHLRDDDPDTAVLYKAAAESAADVRGSRGRPSELDQILKAISRVYQWRVDVRLDLSLQAVVRQILPVCNYHLLLQEFCRRYMAAQAGMVNQALCAAIEEVLQEFHTLIAQLEHLHRAGTEAAPFTLQKLHFYLQPSIAMLERLAVLACIIRRKTEQEFADIGRREYKVFCREKRTTVPPSAGGSEAVYGLGKLAPGTSGPGSSHGDGDSSDAQYFAGVTGEIGAPPTEPASPTGTYVCRGGRTLKIIAHEMTMQSGDPGTRRLYGFLLARAAQPFLRMLQAWLQRGEVHDPYAEFMVRASDRSLHGSLTGAMTAEPVETSTIDSSGSGSGPTSVRGGDTLFAQHRVWLDMTPEFLRPLAKQILVSGLYLNVIRACKAASQYDEPNGAILPPMTEDEPGPIAATDPDRIFAEESFIDLQILESGREDADNRHADAVTQAFEGHRYTLQVANAHRYANQTLLWILLDQNRLLDRLRVLKHYFLLDRSDFLTHFLDQAQAELSRPAKDVVQSKLQALLDLGLQTAATDQTNPSGASAAVRIILSGDRFADFILSGGAARPASVARRGTAPGSPHTPRGGSDSELVSFGTPTPAHHVNATTGMTDSPNPLGRLRSESVLSHRSVSAASGSGSGLASCLEQLSLDCQVGFPLSMIITPAAVTQYQLLFRHLLQFKYTEHLLCQMWVGARRPPAAAGAQLRQRIWFLRHNMLNTVRQILYYVSWEVLEAHWSHFEAQVAAATTIDEVTTAQTTFLTNCLQQSMLGVPKLMRVVLKLIAKCQTFALFAHNYLRTEGTMNHQSSTDPETASVAVVDMTHRRPRLPSSATFGTSSPTESVEPVDNAAMGLGQFDLRAQQDLTLGKLEKSYHHQINLLLEALRHYSETETPLFLNLAMKLNLNGYYSGEVS
ncbi:gamma tubulin complex Spc97/GCP2 subunit Alp4 [Tieghemiomyces parasiticus]|uniref:Spindle pole body component n=1 Tax=Tieghemiomyces parasiticus TaxID=78921 RepID=A0A9W8A733_9FUNG|nr:gamma tubulin complex Spc97/GCP2 subunit Alp4 [Tieghemiomyces parasiticus]